MAKSGMIFGPGGAPLSTQVTSSDAGVLRCAELGLECMELEYVYGVNFSKEQARKTRAAAESNGIKLSVHAPYYINLNSQEEKKVEDSVKRILDSARMGAESGADNVVFHAAFYMKQDPQEVYDKVKSHLARIRAALDEESLGFVTLRPELTGKPTQFGDLDELIRLSLEVEGVLPCVDFSHYHARYAGAYNSYDDFRGVLEKLGNALGEKALKTLHVHLSGIEFTPKGEKKHLVAAESQFDYKSVLKALRNFDAEGRVICESPNVEEDALLFQKTYKRIKSKYSREKRG